MKRTHLGLLVGMVLLVVPSMAQAGTVQSNVVTVTAGHYVQTGTQQVLETVTVPEQQCQEVQVQIGTTTETQYVTQTGTCEKVWVDTGGDPSHGIYGTWYDYCPAGANLTLVDDYWTKKGDVHHFDYTYTETVPETVTVPVYTTEQQCQTVYVQQTQYVTQPVYSWVPTSVSQ